MKDEDIIELYWKRNENAISETENKYGKYCHSVSYGILQNHADADECVNDTLVGAWNSMPPQRPARLASFLGKITRNLSLNRLKYCNAEKRGNGQLETVLSELEDCIPSNESTEQTADENLTLKTIEDFLYSQPKRKRNIFIRRYWYMHSIRDIAAVYGISESKTASLLFRMRNELKARLEKEGINV